MSNTRRTAFTQGFSHAAEWERHEATWLAWPLNASDWPGKFPPIAWVYGEIVRKLSVGETVRIIVANARHQQAAARVLARVGIDLAAIKFVQFPTDRGWTRDSGPMFVRKSGKDPAIAVMRFLFNAWGRYPNWHNDAKIHERVARALKLPMFTPSHRGRPVVLEGGAIDTNGRGSLLTTEECLLDQDVQVRNPGFTKSDMEQVLHDWLGITNVIWLGNGIAGDDTHGHTDDLCRFVNPTTVVLCSESDPRDTNYRILHENRERLQEAKLESGERLNVVELPMPSPLVFDGVRLPASYANFYIGNAAVLVPTFNDPHDRMALGILSDLFTDRPVVGIHAVDLVWGFGTLHCMTHEQPSEE